MNKIYIDNGKTVKEFVVRKKTAKAIDTLLSLDLEDVSWHNETNEGYGVKIVNKLEKENNNGI